MYIYDSLSLNLHAVLLLLCVALSPVKMSTELPQLHGSFRLDSSSSHKCQLLAKELVFSPPQGKKLHIKTATLESFSLQAQVASAEEILEHVFIDTHTR